MKKVIIAIPYLTGNGGTETVIKNFHEALKFDKKSKWVWKLVSFGGTKYDNWMKEWNRKVYFFTNNRVIQKMLYIALLPFLIGMILIMEDPDVFIATNPVIWSIAYFEKRIFDPKIKIVAWYHFSFKRKKVKKMYLHTTDFFLAISRGIKEELISLGVPSSQIDLIYNPINVTNSKCVKRSKKQNHFVYVGRIDYDKQKNVSELMRALSMVKGKWQCDLYGSIADHTLEKLDKIIGESNSSGRVIYHGFKKDVWGEINIADALILTSKYEGLPMVLCEAASRGIALISSNCPMGPSEIINSDNGFLYEQGNYFQLSQIIENVISKKCKLPSPNSAKESVVKFDYYNYIENLNQALDKIITYEGVDGN